MSPKKIRKFKISRWFQKVFSSKKFEKNAKIVPKNWNFREKLHTSSMGDKYWSLEAVTLLHLPFLCKGYQRRGRGVEAGPEGWREGGGWRVGRGEGLEGRRAGKEGGAGGQEGGKEGGAGGREGRRGWRAGGRREGWRIYLGSTRLFSFSLEDTIFLPSNV
jgi:hypothetical protein